jgi:hypothetical protein
VTAQPAPRRGRPVKLFASRVAVPAETRTMAAYLRLDADAAEALAAHLHAQARAKRVLAEQLEHPAAVSAPVEREPDTLGIAAAARRTGISGRRLRQFPASRPCDRAEPATS